MPFEPNSKLITSDDWCLSRREWGPAMASLEVSFPSWQRPLLHPQAQRPLFGSEETFLKPSNRMGPGSTETRTQEPWWPHLPASQLALLTSPVLSLLYAKGSVPQGRVGTSPHLPPPAHCLQNRKDAEPRIFPPESDAATILCPADSHIPVQIEFENLLLYSRNFVYLLCSGNRFSGDLKLPESWEYLLLEK